MSLSGEILSGETGETGETGEIVSPDKVRQTI